MGPSEEPCGLCLRRDRVADEVGIYSQAPLSTWSRVFHGAKSMYFQVCTCGSWSLSTLSQAVVSEKPQGRKLERSGTIEARCCQVIPA